MYPSFGPDDPRNFSPKSKGDPDISGSGFVLAFVLTVVAVVVMVAIFGGRP